MPLIKVGSNGYKWGKNGKVYRGKGAKEKALRQGRAIEANKHGRK